MQKSHNEGRKGLTTVFSFSTEFKKETEKYTKIDVVLSLVVLFTTFLLLYLQYIFVDALTEMFYGTINHIIPAFLLSGVFPGIVIGMVFLVCKIRKQKIIKQSFDKHSAIKSLIVGFGLAVVHVTVLLTLTRRDQFTGIRDDLDIAQFIALIAIQLVYVAFMEELLIRAYVAPRFFGVFNRKVFSVVLVGAMFVLLHVPTRMLASDAPFITAFLSPLIFEIPLHAIFFWLYAKFNNIFGPVLYHFILNTAWVFVA
jgi:membrane protease YdiL (CAAX protease family)